MQLPYTTLDVFTTTRYTGNPLAIVQVPSGYTLTQDQKQRIAKEFNFSETVFLHSLDKLEEKDLAIDIFTPWSELPFAGHPTIGTAYYVLRQNARADGDIQSLITKAGRIPISKESGSGTIVSASIPHNVHIHTKQIPNELDKTGPCPIISIVKGMAFILCSVPSLSVLSTISHGLSKDPYSDPILDSGWSEGLRGTYFYVAQGVDEEGRRKFRTRMFATREDAATGSAASAFSCYFALQEKGNGTSEFVIEQGVEMGRRSVIMVAVERDDWGNKVQSVRLKGSAVKVMEGRIEVDEHSA
ncbi:MAG: hypothetical protein M1812_003761 [Candelaria pacifica]|nr:MAG: hypothetical protein M1812_003761 [Candelaria pacifica]